jgi:hypothetical protein
VDSGSSAARFPGRIFLAGSPALMIDMHGITGVLVIKPSRAAKRNPTSSW